jgi:hypothetical protein
MGQSALDGSVISNKEQYVVVQQGTKQSYNLKPFSVLFLQGEFTMECDIEHHEQIQLFQNYLNQLTAA